MRHWAEMTWLLPRKGQKNTEDCPPRLRQSLWSKFAKLAPHLRFVLPNSLHSKGTKSLRVAPTRSQGYLGTAEITKLRHRCGIPAADTLEHDWAAILWDVLHDPNQCPAEQIPAILTCRSFVFAFLE